MIPADESHDSLELVAELFPEVIERVHVRFPTNEFEWLPPQLLEALHSPALTGEIFEAFWTGYWLACEKPDRRCAE